MASKNRAIVRVLMPDIEPPDCLPPELGDVTPEEALLDEALEELEELLDEELELEELELTESCMSMGGVPWYPSCPSWVSARVR